MTLDRFYKLTVKVLKHLNIPFSDPCDPDYTGDCGDCGGAPADGNGIYGGSGNISSLTTITTNTGSGGLQITPQGGEWIWSFGDDGFPVVQLKMVPELLS